MTLSFVFEMIFYFMVWLLAISSIEIIITSSILQKKIWVKSVALSSILANILNSMVITVLPIGLETLFKVWYYRSDPLWILIKLLPQFVIFFVIGVGILSVLEFVIHRVYLGRLHQKKEIFVSTLISNAISNLLIVTAIVIYVMIN